MQTPVQHLLGKLVACVAFALGSPAMAQAQVSGLINVDISKVAGQVADNIKVDAHQIPLAVQLPVDAAALVCGLPVASLGQQTAASGKTCMAQTTSAALEKVVQEKVRENGKG